MPRASCDVDVAADTTKWQSAQLGSSSVADFTSCSTCWSSSSISVQLADKTTRVTAEGSAAPRRAGPVAVYFAAAAAARCQRRRRLFTASPAVSSVKYTWSYPERRRISTFNSMLAYDVRLMYSLVDGLLCVRLAFMWLAINDTSNVWFDRSLLCQSSFSTFFARSSLCRR